MTVVMCLSQRGDYTSSLRDLTAQALLMTHGFLYVD